MHNYLNVFESFVETDSLCTFFLISLIDSTLIRVNREVKHDVYRKRRGKNETFTVSPQLCAQQSEIICVCNE